VPRNLSGPARLRQDETQIRGPFGIAPDASLWPRHSFSWIALRLAPSKKGERSVFKLSGNSSVVLGAVDKALAVASVGFPDGRNLWSSFPKVLEGCPNLPSDDLNALLDYLESLK
jgi:hypothetical protein